MSALNVGAASRSFGQVSALRNVSFSADAGEIVLIKGHNGAGKSTLLAAIAGIVALDSGQISLEPKSTKIGYFGSELLMYGDLSVEDNLRLFVELNAGDRQDEDLLRIIERFQLADFKQKILRQCSLGMKKRASLARAFVGEPDLLLLDEPFSGLDESSIALIVNEINAASARGAIVVLVTHQDSIGALKVDKAISLSLGVASV